MADFDIDMRQLEIFAQELEDLERQFPKEARQIMLRSGIKAKAIVMKKARQLVRKKTGTYLKSIKRGKVWTEEGSYRVRVYTGVPHGHLIEYGHRIVDKSGNEHGFKEGYHVFDRAEKEIEHQWTEILAGEFDRIMKKI